MPHSVPIVPDRLLLTHGPARAGGELAFWVMTTGRAADRLATLPLGTRVVVRTIVPGGLTDTLGYLRRLDGLTCEIETRRGLRRVVLADVVAAKPVPEPPPRR